MPPEAVGAYLSYNCGYDFESLPKRFMLGELQRDIIAANASPMGSINRMEQELGSDTQISRAEFLEHGARFATNQDTIIAGAAPEIADLLEEASEATGSRGGFMQGHIVSLLDDLTGIVDLLVPELQRRGRFQLRYTSRTLREMLADP